MRILQPAEQSPSPSPSPAGRGDRAAWPYPQRTREPDLGRNAQQLAGGIAQDRRPLGVAQARGPENVLHGTVLVHGYGKSVPIMIWLAPHSATRCRSASEVKTIES